jgi:hypothetical protein
MPPPPPAMAAEELEVPGMGAPLSAPPAAAAAFCPGRPPAPGRGVIEMLGDEPGPRLPGWLRFLTLCKSRYKITKSAVNV